MKNIIKFELKKILMKKSTRNIILGALIINILLAFIPTILSEKVRVSDDEVLRGFSAIQYDKSIQKSLEGYLTQDYIDAIESKVSELEKNNETYELSKLDSVTWSIGAQSMIFDIIKELESGDISGIYTRKLNQVFDEDSKDITSASPEINKLLNMYSKVSTPYYFSYYDGIAELILGFTSIVSLVLAGVVVICISPVFAEEYSLGSDSIIRATKYGKNKVIYAKLISALIFTTILYISFAILNFALYSFTYGLDGFNSNIQLHGLFFQSPYSLTFGQLYIACLLFGYLGLIFMTSITLLISSKSKTAYVSVVISAIILYLPIIDFSRISPFVQKFISLLPINVMRTTDTFELGIIYNIFGNILTQPVVMIITIVAIIPICIFISYKSFKNYSF